MVGLPRWLHAALDAEAKQEGVSLNQLVVTELAMQMAAGFPKCRWLRFALTWRAFQGT